MPTEHDDDDFDDPRDIRVLRRKADRADELEAENRNLKLGLAVTGAKLDPANPATALFLKHYDGEPTVEGLRSAAEPYGIVLKDEAVSVSSGTTETPIPESKGESGEGSREGVSKDESGSTDERREMAEGGVPSGGPVTKPDPSVKAITDARAAVEAGASMDQGLADAFGDLLRAGIEGDARVITTGPTVE